MIRLLKAGSRQSKWMRIKYWMIFRSMFEAFDVQKLADAFQPGLLKDLGLGDFENLLSKPPFEHIGLSRERIIQCCHCGCSTNWLHK
mmetsp:Transcript_6771/g.8830  ORF Transcript_6771/g.8830 Transcript_6771/m.8830 type:complete len:87 (+) Transcript_6771:839-1099(+)